MSGGADGDGSPSSRFSVAGFFPYVLAAAIGACGAVAFLKLGLPLPWVLGPMVFCLVGSVAGLSLKGPRRLQAPAIAVIGVLVGVRVGPETFGQMLHWWPTIAAAIAYAVVAGVASVMFLRRVAGFDLPTAFFGGMPGGLVEMIHAADEHGGDVHTVAILHTARVMLIVSLLPVVSALVSHVPLARGGVAGLSALQMAPVAWLWLAGALVLGSLLAVKMRWPAPHLLGPLAVAAAIHAAELSDFRPPTEIVALAQLVLGTSLGCRFSGQPLRRIASDIRLGVVAAMIPIGLTFAFAAALSLFAAVDFLSLYMGLSAGGVTESTIIALALDLDVAFVVVHHLTRAISVMALATPIYRYFSRRRPVP